MKSLFSRIRLSVVILFLSFTSFGQHRGPHGHPHPGPAHPKHHRIPARSPYRPAVVVVYHPHWGPAYDFHRRWVYFPKHQLYWDNWRNLYFYKEGGVWVSASALPPHLTHLKLENEKHKEMNESEDDDDEIYLHH